MSTLRVDNIKSRTGTVVTIPESNTLAVTGVTSVTGNMNVTGALNVTGGGNFNTTGVGTFGGLTVNGNMTVDGTTTTISSVNLVVEDKNIGIGTTTSPSNTTADGGGITIFGGSDGDKTLTWNSNN